MSFLYLTADRIGTPTGGGVVTHHELRALNELADAEENSCYSLSRPDLESSGEEPWKWDEAAVQRLPANRFRLAHVYSGTFGKTVKALKDRGCKVVYTIAAHDKEVSRREHERLGLPFPYKHLTEEALWQRYIEGYRLADVIVCPSSVAAATVRNYGREFRGKRIEIIPHGCLLPSQTNDLPSRFTVGYLGSCGADKGVMYLLEAWKRLNYDDADLLLGGQDSSFMAMHARTNMSLKNVYATGWLNDVSDFYNKISLYVQPSATEGFGIEVLEAMAHGRPVVCSRGAGAVDVVPILGGICSACDSSFIAYQIEAFKNKENWTIENAEVWRETAKKYTWDKVRKQYQDLWRSLL